MTKWKQRRDAEKHEQKRLRDEMAMQLSTVMFSKLAEANVKNESKEKVRQVLNDCAEVVWVFADAMVKARTA